MLKSLDTSLKGRKVYKEESSLKKKEKE